MAATESKQSAGKDGNGFKQTREHAQSCPAVSALSNHSKLLIADGPCGIRRNSVTAAFLMLAYHLGKLVPSIPLYHPLFKYAWR
ncbi:hypothetical protein HPP92_003811 [Vanilla planifolia]|uniref:Uncharacterized protein n=1 Tax=Vanilla planifolia TaxID=51239 RepID=A0A835VKA4_VANPL|nr:hypothetical protein HPP92_003811 [Vanilla planifolia]